MAAAAAFLAAPTIPISAPSQLVVAGLQTRQRDGRERPSVILTAARDLPFAGVATTLKSAFGRGTGHPCPVCSIQQLL